MTNIKSHLIRRPRRTQRGAALVEFAFVFTFLMFMTFAGIQFSYIMNTYNTLSQISREGARYAAVHCTEPTFDGSASTTNSLQYFVSNMCAGTTISYSNLSSVQVGYLTTATTSTPSTFVATTTNVGRTPGQPVTVQVQYDMSKRLFGPTFTDSLMFKKVVTRDGTMIIEGNN